MSNAQASEKPLGFRIIRPLELLDWKALPIDGAIPLQSFLECPVDTGTPLDTIAALADEAGTRLVRIGCCGRCGYVGYMDRPSGAWIKQFYLSGMWDSGEGVKKSRRIEGIKAGKIGGKPNDSLQLIARLSIDPTRPVCEIGSGFGESLAYLRRIGFKNLVGTEASPHRAQVAAEALQVPIHTGPFEDIDERILREQAPFVLIFAHHVLEHVSDIHAVLRRAALLQADGDYLVLSVPNAVAEPSMAVLIYFPHLRSFTFEALSRLLELYGYEIAAKSADERMITVAARRRAGQTAFHEAERPFVREAETKIIHGLGLGRVFSASPRRLWWAKKADIGGQAPYRQGSAFSDLRYRVAMRLRRVQAPEAFSRGVQSLLVEDLPRDAAGREDPPIQIRFAGPITLFYK